MVHTCGDTINIVNSAGVARLRNHLKTFGWVSQETPFGEGSGRRSIHTISDNFVRFWYYFVSRLRSQLEFQDTTTVYRQSVGPYLNDFVGRFAFEYICFQYLKRKAQAHGFEIKDAGRYWSRDGSVEIDIVGDLTDGRTLVGECKWSKSPVGVDAYYDLMRKTTRLPGQRSSGPLTYILFSAGGFDDKLLATAARDGVVLVSVDELLTYSGA